MSGLQAAIVDQLRRLRELEEAIAVELRKSVADFAPLPSRAQACTYLQA